MKYIGGRLSTSWRIALNNYYFIIILKKYNYSRFNQLTSWSQDLNGALWSITPIVWGSHSDGSAAGSDLTFER